ncbi:MAG: phosphoglucosamine mutase [Pseudomonadota bacterium]
MSRQHFGTDGVRGTVGQEPITPEFMLHLGWAIGQQVGVGARVIMGQDTRRSGDMLAAALQTGLTTAGADVQRLGCLPTAGVAWLTRTLRADAGIVITASHNPYPDNGVKIFSANGDKLPDAAEAAISTWLTQPMQLVSTRQLGQITTLADAAARYTNFCQTSIPVRLDGLRIVLDCAHGAAYQIAPDALRALGAEVITIGTTPDGNNINEQLGATHPEAVCAAVRQHQADVGITLDGDSDRVLMADAQGQLCDGDAILYLLARAGQREQRLVGNLVGTVMTNMGLEVALRDQGIGLTRTQVGDRYILERLVAQGWNLGGEPSGHIICRDQTTTGDGIIAALQVLAEMQTTGKALADLIEYTPYPQRLKNVPLGTADTATVLTQAESAVAAAEQALGSQGRVLLRASGTEPLLRVMVEGEDAAQVEHWVNTLVEQIQQLVTP